MMRIIIADTRTQIHLGTHCLRYCGQNMAGPINSQRAVKKLTTVPVVVAAGVVVVEVAALVSYVLCA